MANAETVNASRSRRARLLLLASPGISLATLLIAMLVSEAVQVGLLLDAAGLRDYHFGAEAMTDGGWAYSSPGAYVFTAVAEAVVLACGAVVLFRGATRQSLAVLVAGYVVVIAMTLSMLSRGWAA